MQIHFQLHNLSIEKNSVIFGYFFLIYNAIKT